jgi:hypothetical protein
MAYFQTENPDLGKFLTVLQWKIFVYYMSVHLVYLMVIWYILWPFDIFMVIWRSFRRFGMLYEEKYGNPVPGS